MEGHSLQGRTRISNPQTSKEKADDFAFQDRNQIQAGINRRDGEFLHSVFERKTNTSGTSSQQFITAMEELGIRKTEDDFKILFRTMDMNNDRSHGPGHIVQCVLQR
jgi:hypothetical protein